MPGHVTIKKFVVPSNTSLKTIKMMTSNMVCSFIWANPTKSASSFLETGRDLGQVILGGSEPLVRCVAASRRFTLALVKINIAVNIT